VYGHNNVYNDRTAYHRVIITGSVVVKAGAVQPLSGKFLVGGHVARPGAAVGIVANLVHQVIAADAKYWWETGKVPLRVTPLQKK
jgi:hypothetical protein